MLKILRSYVEDMTELQLKSNIVSKFESREYSDWRNFVSELEYNGIVFKSETTGENLCYTAHLDLVMKNSEYGKFDYFYIHKNAFSNYFTCYIKSRIVLYNDDSRIRYPDVLIISPKGYYKSIFHDLWDMIKLKYPNAIYVPFWMLIEKRSKPLLNRSNFYEILFGHEGNILGKKLIGDDLFSMK